MSVLLAALDIVLHFKVDRSCIIVAYKPDFGYLSIDVFIICNYLCKKNGRDE